MYLWGRKNAASPIFNFGSREILFSLIPWSLYIQRNSLEQEAARIDGWLLWSTRKTSFHESNPNYPVIPPIVVGRDSSAGITNRYKLDFTGIESWWRQVFPHKSATALYKGVPSERLGRDVDHQPTASADVKERVDLYLYSPSGSSCHILG